MSMSSRAVFLSACLLMANLSEAGQIPDKFTNLKVLPADASRAEVVRVMRGFASALGVRCNHCHVGENPANLDNYDFAADTKAPKRAARAMMQMTHEINERLIPAAGLDRPIQVQCITCHRGVSKPEQLVDILTRTAEQTGPAAALQEYQDLRKRHYGRSSYDFGAPTLNMLAEWLSGPRKNVAAAIEVQEFNVKVNPDIASSYSFLGDLYIAKGDRAAARASFEKALALEPSNEYFKKRLSEFKQEK